MYPIFWCNRTALLLAHTVNFIRWLLSATEGWWATVQTGVQPGIGNTASVTLQGGSETRVVTCVVLLSLRCLWMDLLNPKLLLGAEGKGEVGKGEQEDPSTAVSSAVALGGGTCSLSGEDAWQTPPSSHCCLCSLWGGEWRRLNWMEIPMAAAIPPDQPYLISAYKVPCLSTTLTKRLSAV